MSIATHKNIDGSIKNLETQVGHIARQLADQQGVSFTANTQTNMKEHCKSVKTRSGKVIGKGTGDNLEIERKVVDDHEKEEGSENDAKEENKKED